MLGYKSEDTSAYVAHNDDIMTCCGPFTAVSSGLVTAMQPYLSVADTPAGNITLGIWADNAGEPGTLLATSTGIAAVKGWNTNSISLAITGGSKYWIGYNASENVTRWYTDANASYSVWQDANVYANGVLVDFDGIERFGSTLASIYANVTSSLEEVLYAILAADETISGLVSTRIYPLLIPQGQSLPAITYEQISGGREHTMTDRIALASPVFRLTSWSTTYSGCNTLADAVRAVMNVYSGTKDGITIQAAFLENETDIIVQPPQIRGLRRYGRQQDYKIWFNEILN